MKDDSKLVEGRAGFPEKGAVKPEIVARIRDTADRMCVYFKRCKFDREALEEELTAAVLDGTRRYDAQVAPYEDYVNGILIGKCVELLNAFRGKVRTEGTAPFFSEQLVGRWMRAELKAVKEATTKDTVPNDREKPFDYDEYGVSDRVRAVLAGLAPRERRICELMMTGLSLNGICQALGLKKTNFYDRTWPRLRARLRRELNTLGKGGRY